LEKGIAVDPVCAFAQSDWISESQAGRMDEAEMRFKTATSLDPQYAEAENNLGVVYGQQANRLRRKSYFGKQLRTIRNMLKRS